MDTQIFNKRIDEIRRLLEDREIDQATREQLEVLEIELAETLSLQPANK